MKCCYTVGQNVFTIFAHTLYKKVKDCLSNRRKLSGPKSRFFYGGKMALRVKPAGREWSTDWSPDHHREHFMKVSDGCEFILPDGKRCFKKPIQHDHIIPVHMGGETIEANMQFLCAIHHLIKHLLDQDDMKREGAAELIFKDMNTADQALCLTIVQLYKINWSPKRVR